ncbi:hypothetical protein ACWEU6_36190 [Streptosporangium sandarakinum]
MIRLTARLVPATTGPAHVIIHAGDAEPCGVLTMAPDAAAELVARIEAGELGPTVVTPEAAAHVLHHLGETGGIEPCPVERHLVAMLFAADREHTLRIATVYPAYAVAVMIATHQEGGIRILQDAARQALVPVGQGGGA